jgi:hypothetical protein
MASLYYLDLEAFSLERLQHTLKTEEVLPARRVLKEDVDERFAVLASMGVSNLKELIAALRTRGKLESFAQRSGLSREYLAILGREARSYRPKVVPLQEMAGVNEDSVDKLASLGITHSKHLFDRGRTRADREDLSAASGVPVPELLELVKLSDVARIRGLGGAFVWLFYEAGADTIDGLSRWHPEELEQAVQRLNAERSITSWVPSSKDFRQYVAMAKDLAKVIEVE